MKTKNYIGVVAIIIVLIIIAVIMKASAPGHATVKLSPSPIYQITNSPIPVANETISDGNITVTYSPTDFGLAATSSQILVTSYIPPCSDGFNYCLYYIGQDYKGSNFESAGISVKKRADLPGEKLCLNTPPVGFTNVLPNHSTSTPVYTSSVFNNVGDAGAGHTANGSLYRVYVKKNLVCYEFMTRIGQAQFSNYPSGAVTEFTPARQRELQAKLDTIIMNIALSGGEKNLWK